ncbi:uncharacterized, partial [Tachysurus ichikawai]
GTTCSPSPQLASAKASTPRHPAANGFLLLEERQAEERLHKQCHAFLGDSTSNVLGFTPKVCSNTEHGKSRRIGAARGRPDSVAGIDVHHCERNHLQCFKFSVAQHGQRSQRTHQSFILSGQDPEVFSFLFPQECVLL